MDRESKPKKARRQRRSFTEEFKAGAVRLVLDQGKSVAAVAHPTAVSEFGRYALVECKNWRKPVDAKHIRDFIGKMRNANVGLGIVFSTKGVTGEGEGTDALREIQQAYLKERIALVVVARDDFRACADPETFLALVDARLDALRFDM